MSDVVVSENFTSMVRTVGTRVFSAVPLRPGRSEGEKLPVAFVTHLHWGSLDPSRSPVNKMIDRLRAWEYILSGDAIVGPTESDAFTGFYTVWAGGDSHEGGDRGLPTYLWLRGRAHMPAGSQVGCLEFRHGEGPIWEGSDSRDGLIWRACWPAEEEKDVVYMILNGRGALTVFTAVNNCCGAMKRTPGRTILWTSDLDRSGFGRGDDGSLENLSGNYRLVISESYQPLVLRDVKDGGNLFSYARSTTAECPRESVIEERATSGAFDKTMATRLCLNMLGCNAVTYHAGKRPTLVFCSENPPRARAPQSILSFGRRDAHIYRDRGIFYERVVNVRGTCPDGMHLDSLTSVTLEQAERHCTELPSCRSVEYSTADAGEFRRSAWFCKAVSIPDYNTYGWTISIKQQTGANLESFDSGKENQMRCLVEYHDRDTCRHEVSLSDLTLMKLRGGCSRTQAYESALFMPQAPTPLTKL